MPDAPTDSVRRPAERSASGDTTAAAPFDLAAAYDEHGHALFGFAVNALRDRSAAEDCVQETFLRAWRSRDGFSAERASLRTWLFVIARNVIIDAQRAQQRAPRAVPADARLLGHPRELVHVAGHDPAAALDVLWQRGVRSVLVEGGPTVASAFVRAGLADDYLVYLAPTLIGGARTALDDLGVPTIDDQRRLHVADVALLGTDLLIVARDDTRSTS